MTSEIVCGCIIVVLALAANIALVVWSCRMVEQIEAKKLRSVRDIVKGLKNER